MYSQYDCLESDWKLFRKRIPVWQERYMGRLVQEYRAILDSGKLSSEKSERWKSGSGRIKSVPV